MKSQKGRSNKAKREEETPNKKEIIRQIKEIDDVYEILSWTAHQDNDIRLAAAAQLCPCKSQADVIEFWIRVFQMVEDPDPRIRSRILHIICDGSPKRLELEVMEALEKFNRDPDSEIRRTAHKVMVKAQKGTWNIL